MTDATARLLLVATAACLGCGDSTGGSYTGPGTTLKVMTRNVYFGAEVNASLVVSTPEQIPPAVAGLWATVQQSDFPGRAKLLVDEVVAEQPDIIAFQEMELFRPSAAHLHRYSGAVVSPAPG